MDELIKQANCPVCDASYGQGCPEFRLKNHLILAHDWDKTLAFDYAYYGKLPISFQKEQNNVKDL